MACAVFFRIPCFLRLMCGCFFFFNSGEKTNLLQPQCSENTEMFLYPHLCPAQHLSFLFSVSLSISLSNMATFFLWLFIYLAPFLSLPLSLSLSLSPPPSPPPPLSLP